ncbi:MAG: hypothetical protein WCZ66_00460 [Sphingomonadaceae bacterium]
MSDGKPDVAKSKFYIEEISFSEKSGSFLVRYESEAEGLKAPGFRDPLEHPDWTRWVECEEYREQAWEDLQNEYRTWINPESDSDTRRRLSEKYPQWEHWSKHPDWDGLRVQATSKKIDWQKILGGVNLDRDANETLVTSSGATEALYQRYKYERDIGERLKALLKIRQFDHTADGWRRFASWCLHKYGPDNHSPFESAPVQPPIASENDAEKQRVNHSRGRFKPYQRKQPNAFRSITRSISRIEAHRQSKAQYGAWRKTDPNNKTPEQIKIDHALIEWKQIDKLRRYAVRMVLKHKLGNIEFVPPSKFEPKIEGNEFATGNAEEIDRLMDEAYGDTPYVNSKYVSKYTLLDRANKVYSILIENYKSSRKYLKHTGYDNQKDMGDAPPKPETIKTGYSKRNSNGRKPYYWDPHEIILCKWENDVLDDLYAVAEAITILPIE